MLIPNYLYKPTTTDDTDTHTIHTQRDRQAHIHHTDTEIETDRQTDRHTGTQTCSGQTGTHIYAHT